MAVPEDLAKKIPTPPPGTELRRVWITKYALTKGLYEAEVKLLEGGDAVTVDRKTYLSTPDWWDTKEDAVKRAEVLVKAKIDSLNRQIKTLEEMKFEGSK